MSSPLDAGGACGRYANRRAAANGHGCGLASCWASPHHSQPNSKRACASPTSERKEPATCPDASVVAASVGERLGYEPFDATAPDTLKVTVIKKDRGLQARIEMLGSDGKSKAERVLSSRRSDCADLAATMALAIAIAIDPFRATAPPHPLADDRPPPPPPEPTTIPERPHLPRERTRERPVGRRRRTASTGRTPPPVGQRESRSRRGPRSAWLVESARRQSETWE